MDRGKKPSKLLAARNSKLYMDLKDIVREHALRFLPAKSLFRFQGVCRDWKLHIATPFFAHTQSVSYRRISGLFCQTDGNTPSFVSVEAKSCGVPDPSLKFLPVPVDIRTSSNGFLCCQARSGDKAYYICNPVTKQLKKIPPSSANHGPDPAILLIFEPSLLNFEAEFKLVCAFQSADFEGATEFDIYSSKEGTWKVSGEICFAERKLNPRTGVHVNGTIYWMSRNGSIVTYDLMKDRSQLISCYSGLNPSLGTMEGKLCTSYLSGSTVKSSVLSNVHSNTMHMGSNARTWKEKHSFQLDLGVLGGAGREAGLVLFVGDGMLLGQSGSVIYSYDVRKKESKVLSRSAVYGARVVPYVNTLVCLEQ